MSIKEGYSSYKNMFKFLFDKSPMPLRDKLIYINCSREYKRSERWEIASGGLREYIRRYIYKRYYLFCSSQNSTQSPKKSQWKYNAQFTYIKLNFQMKWRRR